MASSEQKKTAHVTVAVDLPAMFGPVSALSWGDPEHVAGLFGARVESLEQSRRRSELDDFDEAELRDFLTANHPVAVAMYRRLTDDAQLREDPELRVDPGLGAAMLDHAFLGMVHLWYARGDVAQEPSARTR